MCDPVTLASAAMAVTAASAAMGGYMSYQNAKMAEAGATINRNTELKAAEDAIARGRKEEINHYRRVSALRDEQIARFAGAGLDVAFGSPADIITDTAVLGSEDAQTLRDNVYREADGHRINAQNYDMQRESARFSKRMTPITTALEVGSTLLGGYGKYKAAMGPQRVASGAKLGASSLGSRATAFG